MENESALTVRLPSLCDNERKQNRALTVSPSMNGFFRNPLTALLKLRDLEVVSSFAFSSSSARKALDASILVVFESDDLELMRKVSFGTSELYFWDHSWP